MLEDTEIKVEEQQSGPEGCIIQMEYLDKGSQVDMQMKACRDAAAWTSSQLFTSG